MDFKKLFVLIVIIAVAVLAVLGVTKLFKNFGTPSKKVQEKIETQIKEYYSKSTIGYSSIYNGIDLLYDKDKVEAKDLSQGSMIELAIIYAENNKKDIVADNNEAEDLKNLIKVETTGYKGVELRTIVKDLFDVELEKDSIIGEANYLYNYYYVATSDTYVKAKSETFDLNVKEQLMDFHITSIKKHNGNFVATVAVAYVYNNNGSYIYAKDKNGSTVVADKLDKFEFPAKKVDEFTKYDFTLKEANGNYVLVSIEKVK